MSRKIKIRAFKYNPQSKISKPHFAEYEIEETDGMTLFIALNVIREKLDPGLSFDFVCRAGICGSCGMVVNGKPQLACRTLTKDYPKRDDLNWCKRTLTSWQEGATKPTVEYEELDIMKMEMPPAFRGYGAKGNIIEHPNSAIRQAQVDEIRSKIFK